MHTQYRMSRIEEILTKNLFRVIWVVLSTYSSSTTMAIDDAGVYQEAPFVLLLVKPLSLFMIGFVLFFTSRRAQAYIQMQTDTFRDLLVSSEPELKDSYVREYYREVHFLPSGLLGREEFIWFYTLGVILLWRVATVLLVSWPAN